MQSGCSGTRSQSIFSWAASPGYTELFSHTRSASVAKACGATRSVSEILRSLFSLISRDVSVFRDIRAAGCWGGPIDACPNGIPFKNLLLSPLPLFRHSSALWPNWSHSLHLIPTPPISPTDGYSWQLFIRKWVINTPIWRELVCGCYRIFKKVEFKGLTHK